MCLLPTRSTAQSLLAPFLGCDGINSLAPAPPPEQFERARRWGDFIGERGEGAGAEREGY